MSFIKISGGEKKGFKLRVPRGAKPTSSYTRKVIYDTLGELVRNRRVLELFAGSGALGLEALSRGAREVILVDISKGSFLAVRENIKHLGYQDRAHVVKSDALKFLRKQVEPFDLIIADPPYDYAFYDRLLKAVRDVLTDEGIFVLETSSRARIEPQKYGFRIWKEKRGGDTAIYFLMKEESGD